MHITDPPRHALMLGSGAWQRASFDADTALVDGIVQLAWTTQGEGGAPLAVADEAGAGLAFDRHCRLYHSVPAERRVERLLWDAADPARTPSTPQTGGQAGLLADVLVDHLPLPVVLGALPAAPSAEFEAAEPPRPGFTPRTLACDDEDHLFVLDHHGAAGRRVWVVDLTHRRVIRAEPVAADAVDIAWFGGWLWVLAAGGALARLSARHPLRPQPAAAPAEASRLAFANDGRLFVLQRAHAADAALFELGRPGRWRAAPLPLVFPGDNPVAFASGLACVGCGEPRHLVVARRREEPFTHIDLAGSAPYALAEPLTARHYDGAGIAATPDGRVAYWTPRGARHATAARLHYRKRGRVVGFRLDAGQFGAPWGRIFVDACLPANTSLRLHCIAGDDDLEAERVPRSAPANQALAAIAEPEATPLPLQAALPAAGSEGQAVFKRADGSEQPWLLETERFDTHEAVAPATPGRYLWIVFDLAGHSRATPRVRGVRAEHPAHDWLRRLPQLYSRHDAMRSFLQRFLAPLAGLETDLSAQSETRHALLKPCSTPATVLPWLAHWLGLVLDERWSEAARRSFIKEAAWLFRLRGTVWALRRMVEIVTDARVLVVEQFRLRGLGRAGTDPSAPSAGQGWDEASVLGMGLRVGGPVGTRTVTGSADEVADSFSLNAHRFTVLVQADLDADTEAAVRHLLDVHRPAHTLFTLCSLGHGARIGRGLQIGLSTAVGRSGGFRPLQVGAAALGRGPVLGRPVAGLRPGNAVLGMQSRLG